MINASSQFIKYSLPLAMLIGGANINLDAQITENRANKENDPIVVIGPNLELSSEILRNCIENGCEPDIDIDATLAHAENLFVEGQYVESRAVVEASIKRNKQFAAEYTTPVADLYRTQGRLLEHIGLIDKSNYAIVEMRDIIKDNSDDDKAKLIAEVEVAGSRLKAGALNGAIRRYKKLHKQAIASGYDDIAGIIKLREFNIKIAEAAVLQQPGLVRKVRRDILRYIAELNDPNNKFSAASSILLQRLDNKSDDVDSIREDIKSHGKIFASQDKPILLSSDPIDTEALGISKLDQLLIATGDPGRPPASIENFRDRWADFGFFVNEDGLTEDIEVLRISGSDNWADAIEKSIQSRIYAPRLDENNNPIGQYIVERFTYTAGPDTARLTRIQTRQGLPIIRALDLTVYD